MSQEAGQLVNGKYRLVRMLGDGGMGTVWKAQHEKLSIPVALKFLHAELNRKQSLVDRFLQEARASAQIRSEHVVRTSDVDTTPAGEAFIVLEYLEGKTLQALYEEYHKGGQRLTYAEALSFAMQMVIGLEAAHEAGVVHRDLKPDNVMITHNSRGEPVVKLLDFGIAKLKIAGELERGLTRPGVIMGTPEYMAPEQAYSADGVDSRADVFSLGVIVFEMLAGRRPAGGDDPRALAQAYISGQTAKLGDFVPNIAPDLAAAVHKAMMPLAKDRWPTAKAFREAIEPYAAAARPPSHSNRPPAVAPSGGSEPVMPPVALSTAGGQLEHTNENAALTSREPKGAAPPAGAAGVAKTWPPDGDDNPNATKAMSPFAAGSPGTVAAVEMTAMMSEAYQGGGTALASSPVAAPAPQNATAPRPIRKKKKGMSLGAVLGIAGGVAAVVVAGVLLVVKGPTSNNDDDDRAAKNAQAQPVPAPASGQPNPQDLPAIVQPGQPAPPPPQQPQPPQQPPPAQPPPQQGQPRGPRPHPSGAPTAPGVPGVPGVPSGLPNAPPGLPPGMPNIPGLPTAPTAPPPATPSGAPTAPPPPGIPGVPNIPGMPSGLPNFPAPAPFPTPGQ